MRNLAEGETAVVDVRPHWKYLALPIGAVALVIIGGIAALVDGIPGYAEWIIAAVLAVAVVWLVLRYLRWTTTRLIVTNRRIIDRRGILGRSNREIPISAVSDISYHQTIFDRILGAGDVNIESSARDGQETFPDLPHPAAIQNEIYAQIQARQVGGAPAPAAPNIPEQIDQLDQLRRRGVISDEEFAAKKAELLGRL
ncbi:MAG TPA: PH domain-containing protein [Acidimicrobiales bacterium]|nr:PH domain-containing protein [Acidimicrobiales bacterium]